MEPVGPDGLKLPIFKVKRVLEQTLAMERVGLTVKTAQLQGQTSPRADLSYGACCPCRLKQTIFKVKRSLEQILAIDPVGTNGQNGLFSRSNEPRSSSPSFLVIQNSEVIFAEIFHRRSLRPVLWSQFALTAKTAHFHGQTIPGVDLRYELVGPDSKNVPFSSSNDPRCRTSIKTLNMEPVCSNGQNDPYSRSNKPWSR
ncbi:hypothetical protein H5410_052985 [Solanum commersonii]|uniref:Uncharacterized protein n=1 Tax=Solanum commersonii TaxID=4109 RepID=A0A9J5X551_SOLCO|nr:hypothetical protein H5410_052985 [Solanum commersonii]